MNRIIVADAVETERRLLTERLQKDGYDVAECDSGTATMEYFRSGADAVLLSHTLRDAEPLKVLHELRAINPKALVIVISAPVERAPEALRAGAYYVTRP